MTEETAMPAPTPANGIHESPDRPAAASRSRTRAVERTIASALATPPAKRRTMNAGIAVVRPMPAVVTTLRESAPRSQVRLSPGIRVRTAASAPSRWPRKLADATRPPSAGVRSRSAAMYGRIGV